MFIHLHLLWSDYNKTSWGNATYIFHIKVRQGYIATYIVLKLYLLYFSYIIYSYIWQFYIAKNWKEHSVLKQEPKGSY